jgi:hypothetical protein
VEQATRGNKMNVLHFKKKATSEEKLRELILYLLHKRGAMTYGQLCTLLWEIDAHAFVKTGKSITEQKYYRES